MMTTHKKPKRKPVTVARSSPRRLLDDDDAYTPKQVLKKLGERVKRTVDDLQRVIDKSEANMPMPWCEHCQSYHMPTAPHISKKVRDENRQIVAAMKASWSAPKKPIRQPDFDVARYQGTKLLKQPMHMPTPHVILVGDIVSGFDVYGPFQSGHDAVTWKQQTGNRERTQGQWFLMPLKTP